MCVSIAETNDVENREYYFVSGITHICEDGDTLKLQILVVGVHSFDERSGMIQYRRVVKSVGL